MTGTIDVVLDLETFGTRPDSAVVSIGAVSLGGSQFYTVVSEPSGSIDVGSVKWWLSQAEEVRSAVTDVTNKPVSYEPEALDAFASWLHDLRRSQPEKALRIWGSEDFDTVILAAAYRRNDMDPPWHYQEPRGLRTVFDLTGVDEDEHPWTGTEHIAIDCALHAAEALRIALSRLEPSRE